MTPDRIHVRWGKAGDTRVTYMEERFMPPDNGAEYIRADLIPAMIAEAVAKERAYDVSTALPILERVILEHLDDARGEWYFPLRAVTEGTLIPPEIVRGYLRMFRLGGFVEFARGLMTDEGEMAGSGYRITDKGRAAIRNRKDTPPAP